MNNLIKIMLIFMSFNYKAYASSTSRLFLRGYVPPKYNITFNQKDGVKIITNVADTILPKVVVDKNVKKVIVTHP